MISKIYRKNADLNNYTNLKHAILVIMLFLKLLQNIQKKLKRKLILQILLLKTILNYLIK